MLPPRSMLRVTIHRRRAMFDADNLSAFAARFRGELIKPTDAGYDEARKLYNGVGDKRPCLIARCVDVADLIAAAGFGRGSGQIIAIGGGAHRGLGSASCYNGLVIGLSGLTGVRVDRQARTVSVEPGCGQG